MIRCPYCESDYRIVTRKRSGKEWRDVTNCGRCKREIGVAVAPPPFNNPDAKADPRWARPGANDDIGNLGRHSSWGSGKVVFQLPPGHPDRIVTSERQAREVAAKYGIDQGTGRFKTEALRHKAEGTRRERRKMDNRISISPDTFGQKLRPGT